MRYKTASDSNLCTTRRRTCHHGDNETSIVSKSIIQQYIIFNPQCLSKNISYHDGRGGLRPRRMFSRYSWMAAIRLGWGGWTICLTRTRGVWRSLYCCCIFFFSCSPYPLLLYIFPRPSLVAGSYSYRYRKLSEPATAWVGARPNQLIPCIDGFFFGQFAF